MSWISKIFSRNSFKQEDSSMKYLIAGLGNPGEEYHNNRHNIGFLVLNALAARKELEFQQDRYGYTCIYKHKGRQLILLKPTTFMNLSGKAVRYHLQQQKIPVENLLVVTDDLSLPFGKLRVRAKGSHAGHNGLKDIEALLDTQVYARLKFGIGSDFPRGGQADYVLSDFTEEESQDLPVLIKRSCEIILTFASLGVNRTMSEFNKKSIKLPSEEQKKLLEEKDKSNPSPEETQDKPD